MSAHPASLKRRLVLWLLAPLIGLSVLILAHVYLSAQEMADRVYDRVLRGSGLAIAERVVVTDDGQIEVDLPYVALEMLTSAAQDRVYYRVDSDETLITGYDDLPTSDASRSLAPGQSTVYDATYRGAPIRVIALAGASTSVQRSVPFTVYVAETTQSRRNLVLQMLLSSAGRLGATIVAALLIVWLGVNWGLRPLARLEGALGRRSPDDLRSIRHDVPREVQRLVGAINELMARLAAALESQKRFTGNASHQLRTPLSVVKAQLELASREKNPKQMRKAIEEAQRATRHSERLVEQLLLLARVDAEGGAAGSFEAFDLVDLARETTSDFAASSLKRKFDLGFEAEDGSVTVLGRRALLAEALKNLIENAMTYCPENSRITVRVRKDGHEAVLEVEDNGPGIPADRREEMSERFVRLNEHDADGSGLGLAIVREVAVLHGGDLLLTGGKRNKGLCARITIPADR